MIKSNESLTLMEMLNYYYKLIVYIFVMSGLYYLNKKILKNTLDKDPIKKKERPTLSKSLYDEKTFKITKDEENDEENNEKNKVQETFEKLNPLEYKVSKEEMKSVTWKQLHLNMLSRYKSKYPNSGPDMPQPQTDDTYDDNIQQLFDENKDIF